MGNVVVEGTSTPIADATLKGYLAEGARTNVILQSNAFTTTWSDIGALAAPSQDVVGPAGGTTGWTIHTTAATNAWGAYQTYAYSATAYTLSIFAKQGTHRYLVLDFENAGAKGATFDLSDGSIGYTDAGVTATCTAVGSNGWYRCTVTATEAAATNYPEFYLSGSRTSNNRTWTAAGTETVLVYGAQLEAAAFASSYIPTTTLAVARNASVDSWPATGNIVAAQGTIALKFTPTHTPSGTIALFGTYVDADNYTAILHDATNIIFRKRIAATSYDATIANAFVAGTTYRVAARWGAAGVDVWLNGTKGTGNANATAAQIGTTIQIGADGNSLQQPFASIKEERVWTTSLSDTQIAAL